MTPSESSVAPSPPDSWAELAPGARLTIVKLSPDGSEAWRYAGNMIARVDPDCWVVVDTTWICRTVALDGLTFSTGDSLHEWFSPQHFFNAFAIYRPDGRFVGWYANVTYPAHLDEASVPPVLSWHDLYVDLVGLPDGSFTIRDDDELLASGLRERDPALYERIVQAREELIARFTQGRPPFVQPFSVTS